MSSNKKLTLSIVIPVFNEEDYLEDCLISISKQSVRPDQVIVVDNNSTDLTTKIAQKFPFVTLLHEQKQHQSFAQKTGFDHANSHILGRIDGDTILPKDWVRDVKNIFKTDSSLLAITGLPDPYDVSTKGVAVAIFMFYHNLASRLAGSQMLWGANSAISKKAWNMISHKVLQRPDIWEDYDIALLLNDKKKIKYVDNLYVNCSFRSIHKSLFKQIEWHLRAVRTFYLRKPKIRALLFAFCWSTLIIVYPLVLVDSLILRINFYVRYRQRKAIEAPAPSE
ncbi:MAG TPA: glycosyltransferase family 2 protein [Candidatus Saccharimonadales bacterium]|nr:glycosyltransferase family 2 protein [Candidatus Saccharimonadales bacterium]